MSRKVSLTVWAALLTPPRRTPSRRHGGPADQETKDRRAEIVMEIQTGIMARKQAEKVGQTLRVICDGLDDESGSVHLPHRCRRP